MNLYDNYALIKSKISALTEEGDKIKAKIIANMVNNNSKKEIVTLGTFTLNKLKTWTYTKKTIDLGEEFKTQKAKEQSTGDATFVEKSSLTFIEIKL